MRKALLLYNPLSGRGSERRLQEIESVLAVMRGVGLDVSSSPTKSAADTTAQAHQASASGYDAVFACGGDGTIHAVLQGLAGTEVALGIIPMGTANVLAHDLGLPLRPEKAARAALSAEPRRIAVGKIEYRDLAGNERARFFTVALGVGADAHMFYNVDPALKRRFGVLSYYGKATWIWLTHRMEGFRVELDGNHNYTDVTQLLSVRVRNFGGVLREFVPSASLERNDLRLVMFHTRRRLAYLGYVCCRMLGMKRKVREIENYEANSIVCTLLQNSAGSRVFVEADGELLGTLPAKISIVPDALTLLFPKH
ncbi:MAG TPA: diacylglycerol kinase family protein [Terriglobales bacterium]|nr:diacylglycerol kinase family protein [Terriglobales bacterium]